MGIMVIFMMFVLIAIWLYCINDLLQDFKKYREESMQEAKKKKRGRW